jgi:hypothetical protein
VNTLLGNGDGTFEAAQIYAAGSFSSSAAVGDFNGDGHPDLAVGNEGSATVSIFLGKGDGTFAGARSYIVGAQNDLVLANTGDASNGTPGNVSVLLGNGDGTFAPAVNYPAGYNPSSVTVADFNGDDHLDLAVTNGYSDTVTILLGNGDGTFGGVQSYWTGGIDPEAIAAGDFDGDGHLDLAIANLGDPYHGVPGNVSVLLGNANGAFQEPRRADANNNYLSRVAVGDFNGDRHLDLVVLVLANDPAGMVNVMLGNGDGTFQAPQGYPAGSFSQSLAVSDFNRDGVPDLAVGGGSGVGILLGKGDGTFQGLQNYTAGSFPSSLAVGDFNADGFPDLAVLTDGGVTVLLNAANWGGGAGAAPPRKPALHRPVLSQTQAEFVGAVRATSKTRPLPLTLTELLPDAVHQAPLDTERDEPDHAQSSIPSRPRLTVRNALDAIFEKWEDTNLGVLSSNG